MVNISDKEYKKLQARVKELEAKESERERAKKDLVIGKKAVEASGEAILMTDLEGIITYINPEFTKLYGYSPGEVVGKATPRILKSGVMKRKDYELYWKTILSKQIVRGELINKAKDGRLLNIEGSANPIIDERGNIIGFMAIQHDITKRKQIEEQFSETKQMLENIAQGIADGVLLLSKDFKILWANKAIQEQTGLKMENILDNHCYKVTHHRESPCEPPHDTCPVHEVLKTGKPVTVTHTHFDMCGNKFFVEVTAYPVKDGKGKIVQFVHLSKDITERKKTREALKMRMKELEVFVNSAVGRELKMIELENEVNALLKELGRELKYKT